MNIVLTHRGLRLVDITEFHNREESMELSVFQNLCMRHIEAAKEKLLKKLVYFFFVYSFTFMHIR